MESIRIPIDSIVFADDANSLRDIAKSGTSGYSKYQAIKETIATTGLLNTPSVTQNGDVYQVIDGRHRITAIKELIAEGRPHDSFADGMLLVNVRDEKDIDALELSVMGNAASVQTANASYARALFKIMVAKSYTIEQVAARVGQTPQWIEKVLKLNALPEEVKKALDDKTLSVTNAMCLGELGDDSTILDYLEAAKALTTNELAAKVSEIKKELRKGQSAQKKDEYVPSPKLISKDELEVEYKRAEIKFEDDGSDYSRGYLDAFKRIYQMDELSIAKAQADFEEAKADRERKREERKAERDEKKTADAIAFLNSKGVKIPE